MNLDEFRFKWNGNPVDFDKTLGYQCMDLVNQYVSEVYGLSGFGCNAVDLIKNPKPESFDYFANTLAYVPLKGSIAVWNGSVGNGFGHTSIVLSGALTNFTSFDQNWNGVRAPQVVSHNYRNVAGFLVYKLSPTESKYNMLVEDLISLVRKYPKT